MTNPDQVRTISEEGYPAPEALASSRGEVLALRYDVHALLERELGANWQQDVTALIDQLGHKNTHKANDPSCAEDPKTEVSLVTLGGAELIKHFPGLWTLYKGPFRGMMQADLPSGAEAMGTYDDPEFCVEAVQQTPPEEAATGPKHRMDAHRDVRYTAILVIDAPGDQSSGRLVIANRPGTQSLAEIYQDATYVSHKPGTLICFTRGRMLAHVTEPIAPGERRIIFSINYPTPSGTLKRAKALTAHAVGGSVQGAAEL